jgi:uncharacterized protein involved in exopolysaccharide biosynthesis
MDLTLSDFKEMLRRKKGRIVLTTALFAALFFVWAITRDVLWRPEASFRDKGSSTGLKEGMSAIIFGGDKEDSEAISALTSFRLAERLVKQEALQFEIQREMSWVDKLLAHLKTEKAVLLREKTPPFIDLPPQIKASLIDYRAETYRDLKLHFLDESHFEVEGEGEGVLGEVFFGDGYYFVLERDSTALKTPITGAEFSVTLHPLKALTKDLQASLWAKSDPDDSTLVRIALLHPERARSAHLLNSLLKLYHSFLEEEHDRINEAQLEYLQKRGDEMTAELDQVIEKHAGSVKGDLSSSGFTDSKRELEFLTGQLVTLNQKLSHLELDEKRVEKVREGKTSSFDATTPGASDTPIINTLLEQIRGMKTLKASMEAALHEARLNETILSELNQKGMREYQGVSIPSAKELHLAFARERQENEAAMKQLRFLLQHFEEPTFELTSLTAFLHDPVSQEKIMKASALSHALKDEANRTTKELGRVREELDVEKAFLKSHLTETLRLTELKGELLLEKSRILQAALLQMAVREEKLVRKQLDDYLDVRLQDLQQEKQMLKERQEALKASLAAIPDKWVQEEKLNQHLDRHRRLAEHVASLVETKNISNNLELVQSAPLDWAFPPLHPKPPRLLLFTVMGAFLGLFFSGAFTLAQGILNETPLTLKNLLLNGYKAVDSLKRALFRLTENEKKIALLMGDHSVSPEAPLTHFKSQGESVYLITIDPTAPFPTTVTSDAIPSTLGVPPEAIASARLKPLLDLISARFDRVLLVSQLPLSDAGNETLIAFADATFVCINGETAKEAAPLLVHNRTITFVTGTP